MEDETSQQRNRGRNPSPYRRSSLRLPGRSLDDDALAFLRGGGRRRSSQSTSDISLQAIDLIRGAAAEVLDDDNNDILLSGPATRLVDGGAEGQTAGSNGDSNVEESAGASSNKKRLARRRKQSRIYDDPAVTEGYNRVPLLETFRLPRGGTSVATSIGRVQFGIPPETIKDSMRLGLEVPRVYIVPVDRFCREVGPALGINLAECEFPAYFNWFVKRKRCTLVVDSVDAERDIRSVFEETLLGPREFRDASSPKAFDDDDFDPGYPAASRPDFFREFQYFRRNEKTDTSDELAVDVLLDFVHFSRTDGPSASFRDAEGRGDHSDEIGVPPMVVFDDDNVEEEEDIGWHASTTGIDMGFLNAGSSAMKFMENNRSMGSRLALSRSTTEPGLSKLSSPGMPLDRYDLESAVSDDSDSVDLGLEDERNRPWIFSQVRWLGEVATVWPADATAQEIERRTVPRVEIFKMPGASEYVVHDVDSSNYIVGKARFSGAAEVPDELAVEGFLDSDVSSETSRPHASEPSEAQAISVPRTVQSFYPPSFGVTILGNSHGFDKNGSTSGYVIWINGRGVMVDPPPYSSATLEREGIRPQTIIAIIITHCHADHDAGAFQKVLTGSKVAIMTTPSIYNSFIRKYSALSGLSPGLLRRSHRFRPAIIGQPLYFQGATFEFTYTLHTIPCVGFRVEWRGKAIVFTGDHLNLPPLLDELELSGVLSHGRAEVLRQLPLLNCDVLLHEAGAPPIHTPLSVLQELPSEVKERLYVVHTSALPSDCGLRVAPVGTSGTIRLDQQVLAESNALAKPDSSRTPSASGAFDDGGSKSVSAHGSFVVPTKVQLQSIGLYDPTVPPLVYQRPTCVSDAWFILNLLSNVPFFSSLSYMNTMEVLEIARVAVFCAGEVVVPATARRALLCVLWEGTCMNRSSVVETQKDSRSHGVWFAGDWLGPVALQPNENAGEIEDVLAVSPEGVKAIFVPLGDLEKILRRGSALYRKYLTVVRQQETDDSYIDSENEESFSQIPRRPSFPILDRVFEALRCNSVLGKLPALQKRGLEAIAEGPRVFEGEEALWSIGDRCDYAFLIVAGTAKFGPASKARLRSSRSRGSMCAMVDIGGGVLLEVDKQLQHVPEGSEFSKLEKILLDRADGWDSESWSRHSPLLEAEAMKTANDRFANRVLARLYARRKYTSGLLFGRGSFLCDVSRMVSGQLVLETADPATLSTELHLHSSNMVVGSGGCVAMVFPKAALVAFLDENPGTLLCLLGTQAVI